MIEYLLLTVLLYAGLVACAFVFQRSLLYHPDTSVPSRQLSGLGQMTVVSVQTSDGLDLLGWYQKAEAGKPTLVLFHGNGGHIGHRSQKIQHYLDAGLGILLAEYRGYGGNGGTPSEAGLYRDGRAAIKFLNDAGIPSQDIVLYGESLGTGVSVQIALEYAVAAIILESPLTSVGDVAAHHYPYLPARSMTRDKFDNLSKIRDVPVPLLIVLGEQDRVIPIRFGRALFKAANEPKAIKLFPEFGHNDLHLAKVPEVVMEFLSRHMIGSG